MMRGLAETAAHSFGVRSLLVCVAVLTMPVANAKSEVTSIPAGSTSQLDAPYQCVGAKQFVTPETSSVCADPAELGLRNASDTVASPDGRHLYVLSTNVSKTGEQRHKSYGSIAVLQRSLSGEISQIGRTNNARFQNCIGADDDPHDAYTSGCDDSVSFPQNDRLPRNGEQLLAHAEDLAISPDGRNVYVLGNTTLDNGENAGVLAFTRNLESGKLTPQGCFGSWSLSALGCGTGRPGAWSVSFAASSLAISPDGRHVYVVSDDSPRNGAGLPIPSKKIFVLSRSSESGELAFSNCYTGSPVRTSCQDFGDLLGDAVGIDLALSPQGDSLYLLTNKFTNTGGFAPGLVQLARDGSTGALSPVAGGCLGTAPGDQSCRYDNDRPRLENPSALTVAPDGRHLYVAFRKPTAIASFARGDRGTLSFSSCAAFAPNSPELDHPCQTKLSGTSAGLDNLSVSGGLHSLATSADGHYLYATASGFNNASGQFFGSTLSLVRDVENGSLTQPAGDHGCNVTSSGGLANDPSCRSAVGLLGAAGIVAADRNIYVIGQRADSVAAFSVSDGNNPKEAPTVEEQIDYEDFPSGYRTKARKDPSPVRKAPPSCSAPKRLAAATSWHSLKRLRVRLRGPSGGYVSPTGQLGTFRLELSGAKTRTRVRKVSFQLDKRLLRSQRGHKLVMKLTGQKSLKTKLRPGLHRLVATVTVKKKRVKLSLRFRVTNCLPTRGSPPSGYVEQKDDRRLDSSYPPQPSEKGPEEKKR